MGGLHEDLERQAERRRAPASARGGDVAGEAAALCAYSVDTAAHMNEADARTWLGCPDRDEAQRASLIRRIYLGQPSGHVPAPGEPPQPMGRQPRQAMARSVARWAGDEGLLTRPLRFDGVTLWAPPPTPTPELERADGELRVCVAPGAPLAAGRVLSPFGPRASRTVPGETRMHGGADYPAPVGTPVMAVADGYVTHATVNGARGFARYGKTLVLKHPQWPGVGVSEPAAIRTLYAHLDTILVNNGDMVRAGQLVGTVGETNGSQNAPDTTFTTGNAHLHFEVAHGPYPRPPASNTTDPRAVRLDPVAWLAAQPACAAATDDVERLAEPEDLSPRDGSHARADGGRTLPAWGSVLGLLGALGVAYVVSKD